MVTLAYPFWYLDHLFVIFYLCENLPGPVFERRFAFVPILLIVLMSASRCFQNLDFPFWPSFFIAASNSEPPSVSIFFDCSFLLPN